MRYSRACRYIMTYLTGVSLRRWLDSRYEDDYTTTTYLYIIIFLTPATIYCTITDRIRGIYTTAVHFQRRCVCVCVFCWKSVSPIHKSYMHSRKSIKTSHQVGLTYFLQQCEPWGIRPYTTENQSVWPPPFPPIWSYIFNFQKHNIFLKIVYSFQRNPVIHCILLQLL